MQWLRQTALAWLAASALALAPQTGLPKGNTQPQQPASDAIASVSLQSLPSQAHTTYKLIHAGGPFPYEKDGTIFGNYERKLPRMQRGYYREYTVKTPRVRHRGARRIVCGGMTPTKPDKCYYTSDHYNSFNLIVLP